ncbi:MAG: hypothetical protein JNK64_16365 [Myxococcales bacterium]|nr:hypothetical protein [Myxococcales bacterium]
MPASASAASAPAASLTRLCSPTHVASPRRATLAVGLAALALAACGEDTLVPAEPVPAPAHCVQPDVRRAIVVEVSGTIVDFTTGQPVPGATVAITTAWDTEGDIPAADCPLLATVTTDAEGRFGPLAVYAGAGALFPIMLFRVEGGGRALTLSDNRACANGASDPCHLAHTIAAPSAALAAQWRADLASGGMADAAHRGLIAFLFKNRDGSPAAGVQPTAETFINLRPGADVRFVDASRGGFTPATDVATSAAGVAVIGTMAIGPAGPATGTIGIGGVRAAEQWVSTGSLIVPDAIFVEDRTASPPM